MAAYIYVSIGRKSWSPGPDIQATVSYRQCPFKRPQPKNKSTPSHTLGKSSDRLKLPGFQREGIPPKPGIPLC